MTEETAGRARVYIASPVTTPGIAWQGAGEGPDWFVMTSDQEAEGGDTGGQQGETRRAQGEKIIGGGWPRVFV